MKEVNIKFYTNVTDEDIKNFIYGKLKKDYITVDIKLTAPPKYEYPDLKK